MAPTRISASNFLDRAFPPLSARAASKPGQREIILFAIILLLAIISRFSGLGDRALSHDEGIHIYYSYLLSEGQGYFHTPISHGPLQFHLIALLFYLFSASDFIGRVPHALASIFTILLLWNWRKYLGSAGMIVSAVLLLVSPYMLFYGRYARNEAFVGLFALLTIYATLRYLDTGEKRFLFLFTLATALHFTSKETAFIFSGQLFIFVALLYFRRIADHSRQVQFSRRLVAGFGILGSILMFLALGFSLAIEQAKLYSVLFWVFGLGGAGHLVVAFYIKFRAYSWFVIKTDRSFALMVLLITFILPQAAAFPAKWLGWDPLDYSFSWENLRIASLFSQPAVKTALAFILLVLLTIGIGMLWNRKLWFKQSLLFWGIYIIFFTSFFSNPAGFFTGAVGSLGYWLVQQGVERGGQPWFYYLLIQIPLYEFLPALGSVTAIGYWIIKKRSDPALTQVSWRTSPSSPTVFSLLLWWSISSLLAFSLAGEKMPWLTFHIALPMILLTGWGVGNIILDIDWGLLRKSPGVLRLIAVLGLTIAITSLCLTWVNNEQRSAIAFQFPAHQSKASILPWILLILSVLFLAYSHTRQAGISSWRLACLAFFCILGVFYLRTSFRAAYTNFEQGAEFIGYAQGGSGIKNMLARIETISHHVNGGSRNLTIAYDAGGETQGIAWPMKWYMRNYPMSFSYSNPESLILDADLILADPQSFLGVSSITANNYITITTDRMVWPMQDYFDLTWSTVVTSIHDPLIVQAIAEIWLDRDYSSYAQITQKTSFTEQNWVPSDDMRMYLNKEILSHVWEFNPGR